MGNVLLSWEICRVVGALLLGTAPSILEAALALAAALVARLASTRLSARESFAAPQDVKGALRRRIYEKLLRLGAGYAQDFSYDRNRKVLSNLTLEVSPQGMTAVVGVSGSGKSTVASLLCGHERGWTGDVLVGETSVDQVDPAALSRHVTMAAAGAHVFSVTVRENLLMARPEATDN